MMRRAALSLAALCAATGATAGTIGLSTRFVDVAIEGIELGKEQNLLELRSLPYRVTNRGDAAAEVLVSALTPSRKETPPPFEPLPSADWVRLEPDRFRLEPGETGESAVILRIPGDTRYAGRHFEAVLWARTMGSGLLSAGVKSKLRFSIGKSPATLAEERRQKSLSELDFVIEPTVLQVSDARAGKYDVKKRERKVFEVTNRSQQTLELVLRPAKWPRSALPAGYEAVEDLSWVRILPERVKVKRNRSKTVKLVLAVPESLKGRKVAFAVELSLPSGMLVSVKNRVLVEVRPTSPSSPSAEP